MKIKIWAIEYADLWDPQFATFTSKGAALAEFTRLRDSPADWSEIVLTELVFEGAPRLIVAVAAEAAGDTLGTLGDPAGLKITRTVIQDGYWS